MSFDTGTGPRSAQGTSSPPAHGFLSEADCRDLFKRCEALAEGDKVYMTVQNSWDGTVRWARNRAYLSSDSEFVRIRLARGSARGSGSTTIDRIDDAGLREAMATIKRQMGYGEWGSWDTQNHDRPGPKPIPKPTLWSDATAQFDEAKRGDVVREFIDTVEAAGMLTAGNFLISSRCNANFESGGMQLYYANTRAEFSTTVRDAKGTGSGWAGVDDYDVTRINPKALGKLALEKCLSSVNPVAIEPGRYTAILEPQAVADLFGIVMIQFLDRSAAESPVPFNPPPFWLRPSQSKLGLRVLDPRFDVSSDPMDPQCGFVPFTPWGEPYTAAKWIEKGTLRDLAYSQYYGVDSLGVDLGKPNPEHCWRMSGGPTTREEMIATTKRGVIVTRFHGIQISHWTSATCTGFTRDGVWLVEDGKITKPVKNFRFTESPLFMLNKVEQIGPAQRVFSGWPGPDGLSQQGSATSNVDGAIIAPLVKVQDFNFTQLSDAV